MSRRRVQTDREYAPLVIRLRVDSWLGRTRCSYAAVLRDIWVKRDPNSRRIPRELDAGQLELLETGVITVSVYSNRLDVRTQRFEVRKMSATESKISKLRTTIDRI